MDEPVQPKLLKIQVGDVYIQVPEDDAKIAIEFIDKWIARMEQEMKRGET